MQAGSQPAVSGVVISWFDPIARRCDAALPANQAKAVDWHWGLKARLFGGTTHYECNGFSVMNYTDTGVYLSGWAGSTMVRL